MSQVIPPQIVPTGTNQNRKSVDRRSSLSIRNNKRVITLHLLQQKWSVIVAKNRGTTLHNVPTKIGPTSRQLISRGPEYSLVLSVVRRDILLHNVPISKTELQVASSIMVGPNVV